MWEIIGHQKQIQYLLKDVEQGTLKQSYLFTGPEKIGKFTVVRRFTKMLQCPTQGCNNCPICHQIDNGTHPDTIILKDDTVGESIKVDEIREIIRRTTMTFDSPYYIVCIENIERITDEGLNAFLKTLEEPPPHVLFLLTTINKDKILPTILSRVCTIELGGIKQKDLLHYLEYQYPTIPPSTIETIVQISLDRPGLAIEMMEHKDLYIARKELYDSLKKLLYTSNLSERLHFIDQLTSTKDTLELRRNIKDVLEVLLHLLHRSFSPTIQENKQEPVIKLIATMEQIQWTISQMENNINKKLLLEHLMLHL